jgi:gliding motility-associated-like protein
MVPISISMVRKLLTIIGLLFSISISAQVDCEIYFKLDDDPGVHQNDTVLCRGQRVTLFAEYSDTLYYRWEPGGQTSNEIEIKIDTVEALYKLYINNEDSSVFCVDDILFESYIIPDPDLSDSILCYKQILRVGTKPRQHRQFVWRPGDVSGFILETEIKDTTTYYLDVYSDPENILICTDSIRYYTYPRIYVEFDQITEDCPDSCRAQAQGIASGGFPPYNYKWDPYEGLFGSIDSSWAVELCVEKSYTFRVRDTICVFDTSLTVNAFKLPIIEFTATPDTIYPTNPKAEFSFENTSADSITVREWKWLFPDSTESVQAVAMHVFQDSTTTVKFIYKTDQGCIDTLEASVIYKEFEKPKISTAFTPNGDGVNDYWEIPDLKYYVSNEIVIFDRWGKKVYEANNYLNNWDGGHQSDGVYFYILRCQGYWKEEVFRGSITIIGSKY